MGRAQDEDSTIAALKKLLLNKRAGGSPGDGYLLKGLPIDQFFVSKDNLVYKSKRDPYKGNKSQLYVSGKCRSKALEFCHQFMGLYPGITKTAYLVSSMFYLANGLNDTVKYVQECATCQKIKGLKADQIPYGSTFLPVLPYDCLSIDLVTPG